MSAGEEEEDERDVNDGEFDDKTGKSADGDYFQQNTIRLEDCPVQLFQPIQRKLTYKAKDCQVLPSFIVPNIQKPKN